MCFEKLKFFQRRWSFVKYVAILVILGFVLLDYMSIVRLSLYFISYNSYDQVLASSTFININSKTQRIELVLESSCVCLKERERVFLIQNRPNRTFTVHVKSTTTDRSYTINRSDLFSAKFTCDLYNELRRGPGQKVISFSLYGQTRNLYYYTRLAQIVSQIKQLYKNEWLVRIYYDKSIDMSIICELECSGIVDFCNINEIYTSYRDYMAHKSLDAQYVHAMMWRWFPIGDSFVDIFSSRDSDSFVLQREVDSVNIWLNSSDKIGHIMRDHKDHGTTILGGMWGYKNWLNRQMGDQILADILNKDIASQYNGLEVNSKGADQIFLNDYVYQRIKSNSTIHDSHLCVIYQDSTPWPTRRLGDCYVGLVRECNTSGIFPFECPQQCRPKLHSDWTTC